MGGSGESDLELDRRRIRDRLAELRQELKAIARDDGTRRQRRGEQHKVALVGYTNAGKSSLMRALTGSEVLVADQLFATLGTTVRALVPETQPRILLSDTVGFIKNIPHDLVASFRSTLDEAHDASLLLFVVDTADPDFRSQLAVTRQVLSEIGAEKTPSRLLLNKRDRLTAAEIEALASEFPEATLLSALDRADVGQLHRSLVEFFEQDLSEATLLVPYAVKGVLGEIREHTRVLSEDYDEQGARFNLRAPKDVLARIRAMLERELENAPAR
jgi:GTP-binding protein HflX